MTDEPAQYTGYSKQRSIWETSFSQQDKWAPRLFSRPNAAVRGATVAGVAPTVPAAPAANVTGHAGPASTAAASSAQPPAPGFDYLYYRNPSSGGSAAANTSSGSAGADDDLIPTAIVVKNIPFAIKKEQLVEVMTQLGLPLPYAFNYHFDNGVFRGLAFANYATAEETAVVITTLNGREIGGRKLRVEYKKMLPLQERERIEREKRERRGQLEEQHTSQSESSRSASPVPQPRALSPIVPVAVAPPAQQPVLDLNDKETLDLYTSLVLFSAQPVSEVTLGRTSPVQRDILLALCTSLGLGLEDRDGSLVVRSTGYASYPSTLFPRV